MWRNLAMRLTATRSAPHPAHRDGTVEVLNRGVEVAHLHGAAEAVQDARAEAVVCPAVVHSAVVEVVRAVLVERPPGAVVRVVVAAVAVAEAVTEVAGGVAESVVVAVAVGDGPVDV